MALAERRALPGGRTTLVVAAAVAVVAFLAVLVVVLPESPSRFVRSWIIAAANTAFLFAASAALGLLIGFFAGWARSTDHRLVNWPALGYIEAFRGIPRIVIVLMAIVLFPAIGRAHPLLAWLGGVDMAVLWGILALGVSSGAYQAEVFRSGFASISYGQIEAAKSTGMDYWQTMRHVTLPQVIRTILPPLGNEWIIVLKDTSLLVILISIPGTFPSVFELTARARFLQTTTPTPTLWPLIFLAAAAIYLILTVIISKSIELAEERWKVPGLGVLEA